MRKTSLEPMDTDELAEIDPNYVFNLPPLSRQRVRLQIRNVEPAKFYFVPEPDEAELNSEPEMPK